jgi:hypothetical protein
MDPQPTSELMERSDVVDAIIAIFPDIEPLYVIHSAKFYKDTQQNIVERIVHKIITENGGFYPKLLAKTLTHVKRNYWLNSVIERFPDVDVAYARQLIWMKDFNVVHRVTEVLVNESKSSKGYPTRETQGLLTQTELFRSESYIESTTNLLLNEFQYHYSSTIKAVMAECNNDYHQARRLLAQIPASFIWTKILPFMKRGQTLPIDTDIQLRDEIAKSESDALSKEDGAVAKRINTEQYESNGQLIECKVCFGDFVFEELVQCEDGHLFCNGCVERALNEGMYQQGNLRLPGLTKGSTNVLHVI